jgi:glycosyltransferase involved in cell wall biosynthesis
MAVSVSTWGKAEDDDGYDLSVVVPAHNEAPHIARTLDRLMAVFEAYDAEIVVVNDGSTDDTISQVKQWQDDHGTVDVRLVTLAENAGKGVALCRGTAEAAGRWVGWIDADGDIDPGELLRLWQHAQRHGGVVVGNKQHQTWQTQGVPWWRKLVSRTFVVVVHGLYHLPVQDTQTGCKVFPGQWIRATLPEVAAKGYLLDLEVLVRAHLADMPVAEQPVTVESQRTANRIGAKHIVRSLGELYQLHGRYRRLRREIRYQEVQHANMHA